MPCGGLNEMGNFPRPRDFTFSTVERRGSRIGGSLCEYAVGFSGSGCVDWRMSAAAVFATTQPDTGSFHWRADWRHLNGIRNALPSAAIEQGWRLDKSRHSGHGGTPFTRRRYNPQFSVRNLTLAPQNSRQPCFCVLAFCRNRVFPDCPICRVWAALWANNP